MNEKIRVGISACLIGERVRYDGTHELDPYLTGTLREHVEYVPVCPEVECGFPTPRAPFRLVGDPDSPRLVTIETGIDHTETMLTWSRKRVAELENEGLSGFIFKSKSPSSGLEKVKIYDEKGLPRKKGTGIFARSFMEHFPLIPVEDDDRHRDSRIRENFMERIFTMQRWREALSHKMSRNAFVRFHTRHELVILSHSQENYRAMEKLVARLEKLPVKEFRSTYQQLLMEALRLHTTRRKQGNVLRHITGHLKKVLTKDEKQKLLQTIQGYQKDHIPLIGPITLVNHYVRKYGQTYLRIQYYLNPHPLELHLRNHV